MEKKETIKSPPHLTPARISPQPAGTLVSPQTTKPSPRRRPPCLTGGGDQGTSGRAEKPHDRRRRSGSQRAAEQRLDQRLDLRGRRRTKPHRAAIRFDGRRTTQPATVPVDVKDAKHEVARSMFPKCVL